MNWREAEQTVDLLACIAPLLRQLAKLQEPGTPEVGEEFQGQLLESFEQFERACYSAQVTTNQMQQAKFALAATCDELVMSSGAECCMTWMACPLQMTFFGNNRAGEEFFERLEQLQLAGSKQLPVLEIYYVCLQLGFEGAYKIKGQEQLCALMVDLRSHLEEFYGSSEGALSPHGVPVSGRMTAVGEWLPHWVVLSVSLAVVMFLYMGFHWVISERASDSVLKMAVAEGGVEPSVPSWDAGE